MFDPVPVRRHVLVVERGLEASSARRALLAVGHHVWVVGGLDHAVAAARARPFDVVLCEVREPGRAGDEDEGAELLRAVRRLQPWLRGVALAAYGVSPCRYADGGFDASVVAGAAVTADEMRAALRRAGPCVAAGRGLAAGLLN